MVQTLKYRIDRQLFEVVPDFVRAVVVVRDADNTQIVPYLEARLKSATRALVKLGDFETDYRVRRWQDAYTRVGLTLGPKLQPSFVALGRRVIQGRPISYISPMVCVSNLVALEYLTPSGLVDLGRVTGDLVLGFASGHERFEPIGEDKVLRPAPGEVIYFEEPTGTVLCGSWSSRGGKSGLTSASTTTAAFDVDGLTGALHLDRHREIVELVAELLRAHCGAETRIEFLTAERPDFSCVV